jgi:hypothetical protein
VQINKAVARAQKIWTVTQQVVADGVIASSRDSLGSKQLDYFQVQSRVGDLYLPQQVLQLGQTDTKADVQRNCSELYANNLQCTLGLRDPYHSPSVSVEDFKTVYGLGLTGGSAVLIQTLNQSAHIGQSGIAINNSRTAEVRLRYAADATEDKQVLSFLEYTKAASVYPDRTVVKQ